MVYYQAIKQFKDQIVRVFHPLKVILLGSYATRVSAEDSDVDILVILPFEGRSASKFAEILNKLDPPFPKGLLARTPEQVRERLDLDDFFIRDILEKGKFLYEAPPL